MVPRKARFCEQVALEGCSECPQAILGLWGSFGSCIPVKQVQMQKRTVYSPPSGLISGWRYDGCICGVGPP